MGARGIKRNGGEARLLRYAMELQRRAFCPPRDFLEHSGDPVAILSENSQLRYQELQLLATCEVLAAGLLGCDTVSFIAGRAAPTFRPLDCLTAQH